MKDTQLQEIATHLIINASYLSNLGLFRGKMGIILFFVHYAKYTKDSIYEDFAEKLLDEIYNEIHNDLSINFENGLCGIAWGILYLIQNGFVQGDPNEILFDYYENFKEKDCILSENEMKQVYGGSSYGYGSNGCSMTTCGGVCYSDTTRTTKGVCVQYTSSNGNPACGCHYF